LEVQQQGKTICVTRIVLMVNGLSAANAALPTTNLDIQLPLFDTV
jgi:hypothetical protein